MVGGIFSFDGNGTVSGSQSISRNGVFTFDAPILGPYEVAADCTARFLTDTGIEIARVLIVDGGNDVYFMSETAGNAVYGVGKKSTQITTRTGLMRVANGIVDYALSSGSN